MRAALWLLLFPGCDIYDPIGDTAAVDSGDSAPETGEETEGEPVYEDPGFPDESELPGLLECESVISAGYTPPSTVPCVTGVAAWLESDGSTYSTVGAAVAAAGSGETVNICRGGFTESPIVISTSLTLRGAGATQTVFSGSWATQIFQITGTPTVSIEGLTVGYGWDSSGGGGMSIDGGDVSIANVLFERNNAGYEGGAIASSAANLTVERSCFRLNAADYEGGGLSASGEGDVSISGSVFVYNDAGYEGGALSFGGSTDDVTLEIADSSFAWNIALYSGGALSLGSREFSTTEISNSRFDDNFAEYEGGAIAAGSWGGNTVNLTDSALVQNESRSSGGIDIGGWGVHAATLTDTWLLENEATSEGGGLGVGSRCTATLEIIGGGVIANLADSGGGVLFTDTTTLTVTEAHFGTGVGDNQGGDANHYGGWGADATFSCDGTTCL